MVNVMILDDEPLIRRVVAKLLAKAGYNSLSAASGQEALQIFKDQSETIDCVIVDLNIPGTNVKNTVEGLKIAQPKLKVVVSSGLSLDSDEKEVYGFSYDAFIKKPFGYDEIVGTFKKLQL